MKQIAKVSATLSYFKSTLHLDKKSSTRWAFGLRPYHVECTGSRPITEVKPRRAQLVLGWATALEYWVL